MSRPARLLLIVLILPLDLLAPRVAMAVDPMFVFDLTVTASWKPDLITRYGLVPAVDSYAKATLVDNANYNSRIYLPIILDHGVSDDNQGGRLIFTGRLDSPNGEMSSRLSDFPGEADHCYTARAVAHSNDFNIHRQRIPDAHSCMPPYPEREEVPKENCPVLLDLGLDGFHLSGPSPAVSFDINADGAPDHIAWTRANDDDVFLCLDRNQNGVIDNGAELFGYATPLLSGQPAEFGYRALAELDWPAMGGNQDGKVDARDPVFRSLCVWNDRNRDGVSQPSEIRSAEAAGVVSLEYVFREAKVRDSFGNVFWYVSRGEFRTKQGHVRAWPTYDVIFVPARPR